MAQEAFQLILSKISLYLKPIQKEHGWDKQIRTGDGELKET
jgi:hypothetical protein